MNGARGAARFGRARCLPWPLPATFRWSGPERPGQGIAPLRTDGDVLSASAGDATDRPLASEHTGRLAFDWRSKSWLDLRCLSVGARRSRRNPFGSQAGRLRSINRGLSRRADQNALAPPIARDRLARLPLVAPALGPRMTYTRAPRWALCRGQTPPCGTSGGEAALVAPQCTPYNRQRPTAGDRGGRAGRGQPRPTSRAGRPAHARPVHEQHT